MDEKSVRWGVKMHYQGPSTADLDNIRALNRCFLSRFAGYGRAGPWQKDLSESQQHRLGNAPFLLFSFRESESRFWEQVLGQDRQLELISAAPPPDAGTRDLQVAGLSFLWQLSRCNPYVVRLVSGAPVSWCERVAGLTLVGLLDRTSHRSDLIVPRFCDQEQIWQRLMNGGIGTQAALRTMAHQCVLQAMLMKARPVNYERLQVAAASLPTPKRRGLRQ